MSRKFVTIAQWLSKALAVGAMFVAVKPGQSMAAVVDADGPSFRDQSSSVAGVVVDIDVNDEEDTAAPE